MVTTTPIKVDDEVKKYLEDKKVHPREPYNDVLRRELKLKSVQNKDENSTDM